MLFLLHCLHYLNRLLASNEPLLINMSHAWEFLLHLSWMLTAQQSFM